MGAVSASADKLQFLFSSHKMQSPAAHLGSGRFHFTAYSFYRCLAQKVNYTYPDVASFVNAMLSDTTSMSTINQLQQQCATDLFGWEIDIVEIAD